MIAQKTIDAVLDTVRIYDVVKDHVQLKRCGSGYVGLCPFHNERTPSFHIDPRRNICKCFSCGEGGGAVHFLMEARNMSYPEAIRHIAGIYGIPVEEAPKTMTDEQRKLAVQRENAFVALEAVQRFFERSLIAQTAAARKACAYASGRWGLEFCRANGIGYAPYSKEFFVFVRQERICIETLLDIGMVRERADAKDSGQQYSFMFSNRVTIPIRDRFGRVIAFTARSLKTEPQCKYLNSATSCVYKKGDTVFGVEVARKAGAKSRFLYVVEGAPDVLRLQSIGCDNAVAALGTEWTDAQFDAVKGICDTLCFIPDSEVPKDGAVYAPGIAAVMKNGKAAVGRGFRVAVREIPLENGEKKNDPDSYIISQTVLDGLEEQDFVLWYAGKAFLSPTTQLGRTEVIKDVCTMLAAVDDPTLASMYLDRLTKKYKEKSAWKLAYNSAVLARRNENGGEEHGIGERDLYSKYGFFIAGNCYCTYSNKGDVRRFSNFIMQPLYDIPDEGTNTRLYRAVNNLGKSAVISLEPDELNNLQKFRTKVGIAGNYVWLGKIDDLAMVQPYIYSGSETARRIRELGWQEDGFFAYGDGVFTDRFVKADDMGMVKLPGIGLFYLPAFSSMFRRNKLKYGFERSFVYAAKADVGMEDYLRLFVEVFGDNGKVAVAFVFATLFRDFIFDMFEFFPIFNIFGKPQSGKSQLGKAMKGFFSNSYKPINYEGETYPAINRALSQAANCLVHFDEYKNSIEWRKVELLKSMWDGVGRGKMVDGDVERVNVVCGVVLSGQEMPTIDPALFTRILHVTVNKTSYTVEERRRFAELMEYNKRGVCHLAMQVVAHRERFTQDFPHYCELTRTEVGNLLARRGETQVSDRMYMNWVVVLAAFRTLERLLPVPFSYDELLGICVDMLIEQHSINKRSDEVASFWNFVSVLYQEGKLHQEGDYRINRQVSSLKMHGTATVREFSGPLDVLIIRDRRVIQHYQTDKARTTKQLVLSEDDMRKYLERSAPCLGIVKRKFWKMNMFGQPVREATETGGAGRQLYDVDTALAFDYGMVQRLYHLYLTADTSAMTDEEIEDNRRTDDAGLPGDTSHSGQPELPF